MSEPVNPELEALEVRAAMHVAAFLSVACWAANIVAGKEALRGFGPIALAQLRVIGAAVLFGVIFLAWRGRTRLRLTRREWVFFIVMALSGVTLNQLFFIGGLSKSSVAHTGLIVALGPIMVLVLSCLMRLEALTALKIAGMVVSFVGVGVLTVGKGAGSNHGELIGDLILLAGSAVFSYYTILMKEVSDRFDAVTLNMLCFVLGGVMMLPFSARAVAAVGWRALPLVAEGGLAFMVILGTVVPYIAFAYALTGLTASRVAAFNYLQPVLASALAIWLLDERLTSRVVVGGVLILIGVYMTEREREGEEPAARRELMLWPTRLH